MHTRRLIFPDDYRFQPLPLNNGDVLYIEPDKANEMVWRIRFDVHIPPDALGGIWTTHTQALETALAYLASVNVDLIEKTDI